MWLYYSAYDDTGTTRPRIGLAKSWQEINVDVRDDTRGGEKPFEFNLCQNHPNPFNQTTKIEFTLSHSGFVSLQIYDILGRKVKTLVSEQVSSGYKSVLWDGKNDAEEEVASGIYFYQLKIENIFSDKAEGFTETKKLMLLK